MKNFSIFSVLAFSLSLGAFAAPVAQPAIVFDTVRIPPSVQSMIIGDLNALEKLQFGPQVDNHFRMFFGGTSSQDIVRYLTERVHYVGIDSSSGDISKLEPDTYAANFGAAFLYSYFHGAILRDRIAHPQVVEFNNTQLVLRSPRVGFVGIGGAYVDPRTSQIDRIDTWVHEARHSDCPKLPSAKDLALINHGEDGYVSLAGQACTYAHIPCPKGHPLAGELACDVIPWGAYSAGFIFAKNVFNACVNCTEQQKQDALASAQDDYSRFAPFLKAFYQNPNPPAPDLSSYDARPIRRY